MVKAPVPKTKVASDMDTQANKARNNLMEFMMKWSLKNWCQTMINKEMEILRLKLLPRISLKCYRQSGIGEKWCKGLL